MMSLFLNTYPKTETDGQRVRNILIESSKLELHCIVFSTENQTGREILRNFNLVEQCLHETNIIA